MRELFVYYRVRPENAASALAAVRAMQARLHAQTPQLSMRLLWRQDEAGRPGTWMETYASADGIGAELQALIEADAQALLPWIDGPRHTEVFSPCVS